MIDPSKLLDQFLGGGQQAGPRQQGGGDDLLGSIGQRARDNPLASGALAGGLAALLLGSKAGRKLSKKAVQYGGMAVVGGLAYKAYRDWQARKAGAPAPTPHTELLPPPSDTPFAPEPEEEHDRARLLLTAMISAAKADGYIDAGEQKLIFARLAELDLDAESKAYVMDLLAAPLDFEALVRAAREPEVAAEVYAASVLAIDPDHPAERAYLQMLAARLGLDGALVDAIHTSAAAEGAVVPAEPSPA